MSSASLSETGMSNQFWKTWMYCAEVASCICSLKSPRLVRTFPHTIHQIQDIPCTDEILHFQDWECLLDFFVQLFSTWRNTYALFSGSTFSSNSYSCIPSSSNFWLRKNLVSKFFFRPLGKLVFWRYLRKPGDGLVRLFFRQLKLVLQLPKKPSRAYTKLKTTTTITKTVHRRHCGQISVFYRGLKKIFFERFPKKGSGSCRVVSFTFLSSCEDISNC